jgi:hypothetical protein
MVAFCAQEFMDVFIDSQFHGLLSLVGRTPWVKCIILSSFPTPPLFGKETNYNVLFYLSLVG